MVDLMKLVKETYLGLSSCRYFLGGSLAMRLAIDSKELSNGAVESLRSFSKVNARL